MGENHGLKGHLPQPENFTTCGKLGIEINQYNCPIECYDEAVIEEMTEDREMLTTPSSSRRCSSSTPASPTSSPPSLPRNGTRQRQGLLEKNRAEFLLCSICTNI